MRRMIKHRLPLAILFFTLGITYLSTAQNNLGVGLRFGDPTGLTLKKYTGSNAFELNIGRSHYFYGNGWYNNRFYDWYDNRGYNYAQFQYQGYRMRNPMSIQFHYLIQNDLGNIGGEDFTGWDWYYGFGAQFRSQRVYYNYRYKVHGDPAWYYVRSDEFTNIDLGADVFIGLEYTFENIPVSLFVDANLFIEILDNPLMLSPQAGIGARYNF